MKRLIFAITLLFASLEVRAATGLSQLLVTNVNALDFQVNVDSTNAVTNIVKMNLSRSQFQAPVLPGDKWVLTNISGVYGGSTNITTNSVWIVDGSSHIVPNVTNSAVIATNIVREGHGINTGSETWQTKSIVLTNGVNYLPVSDWSQLQLISPSSDPSLVQIVLSNGWNTVQHLEIFNLTNAVPSQGAFTLTNLTPIPDSLGGGVVKLINNENWVATNGCGIELRFISPDWVEQFRSDVSGNPTFISNTFNNITVISNTTLRGRITINNVSITTNTLWTTNVVAGVVNLQPVDLTEQPMVKNGWFVGTNSQTLWGSALGSDWALVSVADATKGEGGRGLSIASTDGNFSTNYSQITLSTVTNTAGLTLLSSDGSNDSVVSLQSQQATGGGGVLDIKFGGTNFVHIEPGITNGSPIAQFGSSITHSTGNLFELANNTTNKITGGFDGILHANRFYATVDPANSPSTAGGLLLSSAGSMFAYATNVNEVVSDSFGLSLWNTKAATVSETNQYSTPLWWKGSWYDTASHDLRVGLFLKASGSYANSRLQMISSTNGLLNNVTNFTVSANSGYDGTGNLFLSSDGTYKAAGGGGGNMTNSGASVVGMVPTYTDTSGHLVTPTNAIALNSATIGTLTVTNGTFVNNMTDSWTNAGTLYTSVKMIVTNTASAVNSKLIDIELSDASAGLTLDKSGVLTNLGQIYTTGIKAHSGTLYICDPLFDSTPSGSSDFVYGRDGKNLKLGTANTARWEVDTSNGAFYPTLDATYSIGTNSFRPKDIIISGTFLGNSVIATNGNLQFGVGTTNSMYVDSGTGDIRFASDDTYNIGTGTKRPHNVVIGGSFTGNSIALASGGFVTYSGKGGITSSVDGVLQLQNNAGTGYNRLQFGGSSNTFPALARNSAGLTVVNATNSGPSFILYSKSVIAKTTNYTLIGATATSGIDTDVSKVLSNFGTSALVTNTLPTAVTGYTFTFIVEATNGVQVLAASGNRIQIAGTQSSDAGFITSTNIGNTVTLVCGASGTNWIATAHEGTWTFGP